MDKSAAGNETPSIERRKNSRLRAIYPDATTRIAHFFRGHSDWVETSTDYMAQRLVHEAYPDLSSAEVRTLIAAIEHRILQSAQM